MMYLFKSMGTIFVFRNIRIVIYTRDHEPPHIHAISPKGEAKIDLKSLDCFYSRGYSEKDIKMILKYISEKKDILMEAWNDIHS